MGFTNQMTPDILQGYATAPEGKELVEELDNMSLDARQSCDIHKEMNHQLGVQRARPIGAKEFGFSNNKSQIIIHWILAAMVGITLRLVVFPQAAMAADMTSDDNVAVNGIPASHRARQTAFLVSFGCSKAICNVIVGRVSDTLNRKTAHTAGWGFGILLSMLLLSSTSWTVIVLSNILLGAQQAIAWSTNIFMMTDILGPKKRAFSNGLSNCTGYLCSALAAFGAAAIVDVQGYNWSFGAVGLISLSGFLLSLICVEDTLPFVAAEVASEIMDEDTKTDVESDTDVMMTKSVQVRASSWKSIALSTSINNVSCASVCLAGFTANLVTGLVWGLVLIWSREHGLPPISEAIINATYTLLKAVALLLSGYYSDMTSKRKPMLVSGLGLIVCGLIILSLAGRPDVDINDVRNRLVFGSSILGLGTGILYPVMGAAIGDHTPAINRATALGIYRFCRDLGYAAGGLIPGAVFTPHDVGESFVITTLSVAIFSSLVTIFLCLSFVERFPHTRKKGGDVVDSAL